MTDPDDTLSRLFAEARQTPSGDDFQEEVASRIHRARRRGTIGQVALAAAAAGLAIGLTPYAVAVSLTGAGNLGVWVCTLGVAAWGLRRARRLS
jgi:hypothetical protein